MSSCRLTIIFLTEYLCESDGTLDAGLPSGALKGKAYFFSGGGDGWELEEVACNYQLLERNDILVTLILPTNLL